MTLPVDEPSFALLGPASSVDVGNTHACAIGSDGQVTCWGSNSFGQAAVPAALGNATQVSAGGLHTCALKSDGGVVCWGRNANGQTDVPAALGSVRQVSAGGNHTCALKSDGAVACWGYNDAGQTNVPAALGSATLVTAGPNHSCAVKTDGGVVCWGSNVLGQTNVPATLGTATQVIAERDHTCALKSDGGVACWGSNQQGQTAVPATLSNATQVSAGTFHTCALKSDGGVACWGFSGNGATAVPATLGSATQLSAGGTATCAVKSDGRITCWGFGLAGALVEGEFSDVAPGAHHSCALTADGSVVCWGLNASGQTAVPATLGSVTQVSVGQTHTCALKSDGAVACWGNNQFNQVIVPPLVAYPPPGFSVRRVTAGTNHTCAAYHDDVLNVHVICWGDNQFGQTNVPANLTGGFEVSAGGRHTCAVQSDGSVVCWGSNQAGQTAVPAGLTSATSVSAGAEHTCARKSDGGVECWGNNSLGQSSVPAALGSVTQVSAGYLHTCALKSDASVACWGYNGSGQTSVPADLGPALRLRVAVDQSCVVKSDHTIECWGSPTSTSFVPQEVTTPAIVFEQGPRWDESNALRSNVDAGANSYEYLQQIADGFTLAARSQVEYASWEGSYFQMPLGLPTVAFRIQIYADLSQAPLYDAVVNADYVQVGTSDFGSPIYRFASYLTGPVLEANTKYWIAILESDASTSVDFRWWKTVNQTSGDFAVRGGPGVQWYIQQYDFSHDFVFQLGGSAVAPGSTPTGSDVSVQPVDETTGDPAPVSVAFDSVSSGGETSVTSGTVGQGGPPSPSGFRLGNPPTYYDVQTTATFIGFVELCFDYSGASYGNENNLKLLHYENGAWIDVTTSLNTTGDIICGIVTSLSPFLVAETNEAPLVTTVTLPAAPVPVGTSASVTVSFTDGNPGDTHTAVINWDDGTTSSAQVSENAGAGTASAAHVYTTPGVYTVIATVSDGDLQGLRSSSDDQPAYIVVFDPTAGFVTGGGWFDSPAGACLWSGCAGDGSTVGKASFGFVSRYKKGATTPSGSTEFQFKAGGLAFHSTSYQWLVVAGNRAQYKGEGAIDGSAGTYGFLITAIDGDLTSGGGTDRFRIKIWDVGTGATVYDNQMGGAEDADAATALGGGSIVIHN